MSNEKKGLYMQGDSNVLYQIDLSLIYIVYLFVIFIYPSAGEQRDGQFVRSPLMWVSCCHDQYVICDCGSSWTTL